MDSPSKSKPKILYKYRSFKENITEAFFVKNEVWFASPNTLNDPFDSQIIPEVTASEEEIRAFAKIYYEKYKYISPTAIEEMIATKKYQQLAPSYIDYLMTKFGVYCLTEDCTNLLMWSHYADYHSGFCLGFDTNHIQNVFKIGYSTDYPQVNMWTSTDNEKVEKIWLFR